MTYRLSVGLFYEKFEKGRNNMAIVVPEIFADATNAALDHSIRIGRIAFDATDLVGDIRECGDTVHFPVIDRISDAEVMEDGTELTPSEVSMTDNTAKIKQVGKAVRIYDKHSTQVKGQLIDNMATQIGESMADAIDKDLIGEMDKSAVYKVSGDATSITYTTIEAAFDCFGDKADRNTAGIIINSRLRSKFLSMDEFVKNDRTYVNNANGTPVDDDGVIGYWRGSIPVILSNNGTYDEEKLEVKTYIVKNMALGIIKQKDASIEEQRESLKKATLISADEMYAVKLIDPKGVVIIRKTIE
jgi:hypothetical protein